jgi:hypothetical protein
MKAVGYAEAMRANSSGDSLKSPHTTMSLSGSSALRSKILAATRRDEARLDSSVTAAPSFRDFQ